MKNKTYFIKLIFAVVAMLTLFTAVAFAGVHGDVDNDGSVKSADARLALRASVSIKGDKDVNKNVLNFSDTSSREYLAANVDGKAGISSADARLILRASVGLETLGHTYGSWVTEKKTNGVATGNHSGVCLVCGEKVTVACTYGEAVQTVAATCTSPNILKQTCSVCGGTKTSFGTEKATGHKKTTLVSSTPATCTTAGKDIYYCALCKKNITYTIKATGHTPNISAATCTQDKICTTCKTVLEEKHHTPGKAASCLANQVCTVCGEILSSAKGHTPTGAKATCTTNQYCGVCGEIAVYAHHTDENGDYVCDICKAEMKTEKFNDLVNVLKDGTHKFSGFSYSETTNAVNDSKITYSTGFKALVTAYNLTAKADEKMPTEDDMNKTFKDEFTSTESAYTLISKIQKSITNANFPITDTDKVSQLVDGDIASITEETVTEIDFLNKFGDTVELGKSSSTTKTPLSLARYKNATFTNVKKVTVTLNQEKYSELKNTENPTAIMRIGGTDIRELASQAGILSNSADFGDMAELSMTCKEITSNAKIVYYFDASNNNAPIAAEYSCVYSMNNKVTLKFEFLGEEAMDGYSDFTTNTTENLYYFFDNYFPET